MHDESPLAPLPHWASWTSKDPYRPESFHSKPGFALTKNRLHVPPTNIQQQVCMVLGIGLSLRDIMQAVEIEPDETPSSRPQWLAQSPLTVADAEALLANAPALQKLAKR